MSVKHLVSVAWLGDGEAVTLWNLSLFIPNISFHPFENVKRYTAAYHVG